MSRLAKLKRQEAKRHELADGQGAAKRKRDHKSNSPRHRRAFRDVRRKP